MLVHEMGGGEEEEASLPPSDILTKRKIKSPNTNKSLAFYKYKWMEYINIQKGGPTTHLLGPRNPQKYHPKKKKKGFVSPQFQVIHNVTPNRGG
jgi:hypothetical protein